MNIVRRIRSKAAAAALVAVVGAGGIAVAAPSAGATVTTAYGANVIGVTLCAPWGYSTAWSGAHYRQVTTSVAVSPESGRTSQYVTGRAYLYRRSTGASITTAWRPSVLATATGGASLGFDFTVSGLAATVASDFEVYVQVAHWTGSAWRYSNWLTAGQLAGVTYGDYPFGNRQTATSPYAQYSTIMLATAWNWSQTCTA